MKISSDNDILKIKWFISFLFSFYYILIFIIYIILKSQIIKKYYELFIFYLYKKYYENHKFIISKIVHF